VKRCYHDLGLRGVKMVPHGWYPDAPEVMRLYETITELGMYVVFHSGIFLDGREGKYCRPAFFEGVHQVPEMRAQLAHLGWPWIDECVAVMALIGYASDAFWPSTPDRYDNQFLRPQLGLFETAATNGHIAEEGSPQRIQLREGIFHDNIWQHWQQAVREPQQPRRAKQKITTPRAKQGPHHKSYR
jgi:hypothetical protein